MLRRYDIENKDNKTEEDAAQIKSLYGEFGACLAILQVVRLAVNSALCILIVVWLLVDH